MTLDNGIGTRCLVIVALLFTITPHAGAQDYRRWQMNTDGSIVWMIKGDIPHSDHIEMSGKRISCVLRYGVAEDGSFEATRSLVWPMLRTVPNNTHASFTRRFALDGFDLVTVNAKPIQGDSVSEININGTLSIKSKAGSYLELTRQFFPSATRPAYIEIYTLKNTSSRTCVIEIPRSDNTYLTDPAKGTEGSYAVNAKVYHHGSFNLGAGEALSFSIVYTADKADEEVPEVDAMEERDSRLAFINEVWSKLILETPDSVLNRAFAFAKIRGAESIYQTKGGPMHGPGGEAYYAAIWANDQAEYIGPFFPFLGYAYGNEASLNAYLHFARFMNDKYTPIPSSIIAEGTDIWNGAGDRGDGAMIAYGAARYALASGDRGQAEQLWPLIEWCLEYCRRQLNSEGVVRSDADELEGRLPAGAANLCTSSLYYDALQSAIYMGEDLGKDRQQLKNYKTQAARLASAIEKYFGANVGGFQTYRYYKENDTLRAWICIPLTMGIYQRKAGTIAALFSPQLWTPDGLASRAGDITFWDRSTLYGFRGVLAAGEKDRVIGYLHAYSNRRLLGDHVPYPVEAYPEGSQRHLSAESGLYCRVFTEGLFGIRPAGLNSFTFTPQLPLEWPSMGLRHIRAFGHDFDIQVERTGERLHVEVTGEGTTWVDKVVNEGEMLTVHF